MITALERAPAWRLVATRSPGVDVFQGLSDFGEWEELYELESFTNERLRLVVSNLAFIPRERRALGPGSAYIMAPFAYWAPGRFGDGSFGVLYAALDEATTLAEVAFHRARFLRATRTPRETATYQMLSLKVAGAFEDLRGVDRPELFDPDPAGYGASQAFATGILARDGDGVLYPSVRRLGGTCVAGFRPDRFSDCRHLRLLSLFWDGDRLVGPDGCYA